MAQWAVFYFPNCKNSPYRPTCDLSIPSTLAYRAMLTIPILDFQSNPALLSPLWHFVKVRVQGSCVLCAQGPALFIPNPSFFSYSARMERCTTKVMDMDFLWFDSMKRSEEGTMKWQWGLHIALTGTRVLTSPWNGTGWAIQGPALPEPGGSLEPSWPRLLPLRPWGWWVLWEQSNNLGCRGHHMLGGTKLGVHERWAHSFLWM